MLSIGDRRNPCRPLLQAGTRSPDPSRNWDRMRPPLHLHQLQLWPLSLPTRKSKTSNPSLRDRKRNQGSRKLLRGLGLRLRFPLLEPAGGSLWPGRWGKLVLAIGNRSRPRLGGQEGPRPRTGVLILSATLAEGQRPHPHTCPAQGKVCGAPQPAPLRERWGGGG